MMHNLEQLREKIEKIDTLIIENLAEREKLVLQIGQLKAQAGIAVLDVQREKDLMAFHAYLSDKYKLDLNFIRQLFALVFEHSKQLQRGEFT